MNGLEQLRLDRGLTVAQVAEKVKVAPKTIRAAESGSRPHAKTLAKLSTFFGVKASYLVAEVSHEIQEAA
jgi:transcriptional regulator with XRE-family HTH domain